MSKTFYFEDPNGTILSEDGKRKFKKMDGKSGYEFLRTEEGKGRRFIELVDPEDENNILKIEVPGFGMKAFRQDERHEQYVTDTVRNSDYSLLSLNYEGNEDSEEILEFVITDEDADIHRDILHRCDLETLKKALTVLSEEEYALIYALFLSVKTMTVREYAKQIGVSHTAIVKRKNKIFKKIKSFF